jgi:RimJ/RimL family protein N-acetyltransferase
MSWADGGQPELRTERLVLRPFHPRDVEDVFAFASDEEWSRYLEPEIPYPYELSDAVEFVEMAMNAWPDGAVHWAIERRGSVIGAVALAPQSDEVASIGYNVGREFWGQGFTTEAVQALLDYAFFVGRPEVVVATADARNVGSWRVMEKLGMRQVALDEGVRQDRAGEMVDRVSYRIERWQWTGR